MADEPKVTSTDPLDQVAIATVAWRRAVAATPERQERDRKIIAAFDAGRTGTDIAAASGLPLADVYRVHSRADLIRSDDEIDRKMTANRRRIAEMLPNVDPDET